MMPQLYKFAQHSLGRKILLCVLIGASLVYVAAAHQYLYTTFFASSATVAEHEMNTSSNAEVQYWNSVNRSTASDADEIGDVADTSGYTQQQSTTVGKAAQQQGHPSLDGSVGDYRSTVGKIFFSDNAGRNYVCSGTAVVSANKSVVDTAGHCLYGAGNWMQNVIFCPLYDHGQMPYGCWAARELLVPADWERDASLSDLHHDMGIVVVAPNDAGYLTDVIGGAGWAYNQKANQPFYAYGYPAGHPFDGQSQRSCEAGSNGTLWQHGGGTVVSIPCNMTGGSSGGGWFIQSGGQWYLNGHNDFTSSMKRDHMFSPYYDDTWYTMYSKAQNL